MQLPSPPAMGDSKMQQQYAASYSTANPTNVACTAALHVQLHQMCQDLPPPTVTQTTLRTCPRRDA
eukprot:6949558-Ditylum_brightwellii.AAC.1